MDEQMYWPSLERDESTKCIYEFMALLKEQLKSSFNGRIDCSFDTVTYKSNSFLELSTSVARISKAIDFQQEESLNEKGREAVRIQPPVERKFVLFNDKYFFRVFDMKIGNYFPVEIKPAEGIIVGKDDGYKTIQSESDLKQEVLTYLNSKFIKDVLRYMINL